MKKRFLELVEKVKQTGIVEVMYEASTAEELKEVWRKFLEENPELITKIKDWAEEFKESKTAEIFKLGEKLENPMEIAIVIFIIGDENVSEFEIFVDWKELLEAMKEIDNDFAKTVAEVITDNVICKIQAEDIYSASMVLKISFLKLVEKVKQTEIAEAVCKTTSAEELKEVWQKFLSENPDLIEEIKDWAEKFKKAEAGEIFVWGEELENPMEIAVVLFIINDKDNVSEGDIFEDWEDLTEAMREIERDIVKRIVERIECDYICNITAEDIFPEEDDAGEAAEEN